MPDQQWTVTMHVGPDGLDELEGEWHRLYDAMPDPAMWHSVEAYRVYLRHLCARPERFRCMALHDGERVRAILPLEERQAKGFIIPLRVWGVPFRAAWWVSDAIGPEDEARRVLIPAVVDFLRGVPDRPTVLGIGRTRDDTVLWEGFESLGRGAWRFHDGAEFVMATDRCADDYFQGLTRKARQIIRKALKEFDALPGAEQIRVVAHDEVVAEYECFLEVEASGWKGQRGSAIMQHPELTAFYRDLIDEMSVDGHVEIHSLRLGERCIASEYCVYTRHQVDALKSGYAEEFGHLSPGILNVQKTLEWSCGDANIRSVSQISNAPWFTRWRPLERRIMRGYTAIRPVTGAIVLGLIRLRFGVMRSLARSWKAWRLRNDDRQQRRPGRDAG